jgi:molybdopterin-binding protein
MIIRNIYFVCARRCFKVCFTLFSIPRKVITMSIQSINARNQFHGTIKDIIFGSVVSEVEVETPFGIVTSVITTRSIKDLDLQIGAEVLALVKSTEVSIAKL